MKVKWIRGKEAFRYNRPYTWFCLGVRGAGKSSFLESVASRYLEEGSVIFDLFGSRDGEGLAWLRSTYAKDKKILLVKGDNIDVDCSFPVKHVEKLTLNDFENYDIIISASPLYQNIGREFYHAAQMTDRLYTRLHYKRLVFMVCREAANLYYSRLKVDENQIFAKSQMVYMIREARHIGLSLGLDSVRFYAIDIDIRTLSDYMILKSQGVQGLTRDLKFLYSYVDPHLIRKLGPSQFIVLTRKGNIGYGVFPEVPWHKKERENILQSVGIKIEVGEQQIQEPEFKGSFKTVGDREHANIIKLYVEEALSMDRIAEKLERSTKTVHNHIHEHNRAIARSGFCSSCKRTKSQYYEMVAERRKV